MSRTHRVLVLGGSGMLGHKVLQALDARPAQFEVFGTFRAEEAAQLCRRAVPGLAPARCLAGVDAIDIQSVERAVDTSRPQAIVNCIGVVKQSGAIDDAVPTIRLNALLPHQLAALCAGRGIRLIQLSTDCVFSGRRGAYNESDIPDPVDFYGHSKLLGEVDAVNCLTLRTSIIGWELEHHRSLLGWFATQRGRRIKGFRRAVFSGLPTSVLAGLLGELIASHPALEGLYHVASQPISKFELLSQLQSSLGWRDIDIQPDDELDCDRSLDGRRFAQATGWTAPPWSMMIPGLAAERAAYESGGAQDGSQDV
ncbi:MAG TPA: SDR family oxidoreductase [Ramlibacter sp.]|nr:SDR family oxidoreductase [Ramlibacter sp.]